MKIALQKLAASLLLLPGIAAAEAGKEAATDEGSPRVHLIDHTGALLPLRWPHRSEWDWKKSSDPSGAPYSPVFRTWLGLAADESIEDFKSKSLVRDESPRKRPVDGAKVIAIDLEGNQGIAEFVHRKEKSDTPLSLMVEVPPDSGTIRLHESCEGEDLDIRPVEAGKAGFTLLAASCRRAGKSVEVHVFHPDSKLSVVEDEAPVKGAQKKKDQKKKSQDPSSGPWSTLRLEEPESGWTGGQRLARLGLAGSSLELVYGETSGARKFTFNAGTALTFITYSENPESKSLGELAWTLKGSARYELLPNRLSVGSTIFVNAIPFKTGGNTPSAARFYGINGRVSYRLPWRAGDFGFRSALGVYFWGMLVPSGAKFGIRSLVGPSLTLSADYGSSATGQKPSAYLKYAPIRNLSSFEVAIGGSYPAGILTGIRPMSFTLDLSTTYVGRSGSIGNSFRMYTFSLGASYGF